MASSNAFLATSFLTSGLGEIGSGIAQSSAAKAQGEYQESINETNARLAEMNAKDAIARGERQVTNYRNEVRRLLGTQKVAFAAQGGDVTRGSARDVMEETRVQGEIEALTLRNNAWKESWGFRVEAEQHRTRGKFAKLSAKNESRNTLITAGLGLTASGMRAIGKVKE